MRKLKITELNRISAEEFKQVEKLPLVVVLDDIRSLHNIGSVFRTSDAFRIECIYLCGITATPPHPEMHKTALGAEFTVDWKYVNNAVDAVDNLKNEGYIVYSVEQAEGSIMLDELQLDKTKKYAIVMGNEVKGVQQEVIDHSDGCIEIPQYGTKHSLNVSVTTGIVIWEDEKAVICTVGTLAKAAEENNITKTALMIIGDAVTHSHYERSELYNPAFTTEFRQATKER